jgi:hypothetical protein
VLVFSVPTTHNPLVLGSSPSGPTKESIHYGNTALYPAYSPRTGTRFNCRAATLGDRVLQQRLMKRRAQQEVRFVTYVYKKTPAWDAGEKVGYGAIKRHLQAH